MLLLQISFHHGLPNLKMLLYALANDHLITKKKTDLRPPFLIRELVVLGLRNVSAPPSYDVNPTRFVLNHGNRKLNGGGVTHPGFIRWPGLEQKN